MLLPTETFHDYIERHRLDAIQHSQQRQGWAFLMCLLAIYLWPCYLLATTTLPAPSWLGRNWHLGPIPITLGGLILYLLGSYALIARTPRHWWRFVQRTVSLPHVLMISGIWMGVAWWGELVMPYLNRQIPQLIAGVLISLMLAGGHYGTIYYHSVWNYGSSWRLEVQQIWSDYLQDLHQSLLLPYYQQLERARQLNAHYRSLYQDLQLEELEAYYLATDFHPPLHLVNEAAALLDYSQAIALSRQRLSQLLHQFEEGIRFIEAALLDLEVELDCQRHLDFEANLQQLEALDLSVLSNRRRELWIAERTMEVVMREMTHLSTQVQTACAGKSRFHPTSTPYFA